MEKSRRDQDFKMAYRALCAAHGLYISTQGNPAELIIEEVGTRVWEGWSMGFYEPRQDAKLHSNYCQKCNQSFAAHNFDGSCVEDEQLIG